MASQSGDLKVYTDGKSYLAARGLLRSGRDPVQIFSPQLDQLFPWICFGSVGNHMPYSEWHLVSDSEIPPRLLELLAGHNGQAAAPPN